MLADVAKAKPVAEHQHELPDGAALSAPSAVKDGRDRSRTPARNPSVAACFFFCVFSVFCAVLNRSLWLLFNPAFPEKAVPEMFSFAAFHHSPQSPLPFDPSLDTEC